MNWKWATATTFPGHGETSHRIEAQKSRLSGLPETLLERGGAGSALFPISPGILSHRFTVSCLTGTSPPDFHDCITSLFPEFSPFKRIHIHTPTHIPDIALITQISHRFHQEFMSPVGSSAYLGVNLVRYIWPLTSSVTPASRHSKPPRPQWPKSTADTYFRFGRLCPARKEMAVLSGPVGGFLR